MGAKKISLKGKGCYATYKATGRYEKNRKRDLERHLKKYPNDECAKAALKNISYRRATPKAVGGWIDRKDPSYHGVPANTAQVIAQVKKIVSKVNRELATNRPYQDLLKKIAVETQNRNHVANAKDKNSNYKGSKPNHKNTKKSGK